MKQRLAVVGVVLLVVVLGLSFFAWHAFQARTEANSEQLADEILAVEAATYARPVHREPVQDGSFGQCVEALAPLFSKYVHTVEFEWWAEHKQLCFGAIRRADLSEEAKRREAMFKPLRPRLNECLREAKIAPGKILRFSEVRAPDSSAFGVMNTQMGLSNCGAIIEQLEQRNVAAALAECTDAFAWYRDAALMGAGHRLGDAASVGLPVVIPCGEAINAATDDERAVFAKEMRLVRAGLPGAREMADRQRLRLSLGTYAPLMTPNARNRVLAVLVASDETGESLDDFTEQLATQSRWSARNALFREVLEEIAKPRSPERERRLDELSASVVKDRESFSTVHQMIEEAAAQETVDAALELLIGAAEFDIENAQTLPGSSGYSSERLEQGVGFKLLLPKPTRVIVWRTRAL